MGTLLKNTQAERDAMADKAARCETAIEQATGDIRALVHEKDRLELQVQASSNEFQLAAAAVAQKERNTTLLSDELSDMGRQVELGIRDRNMLTEQRLSADVRREELETAFYDYQQGKLVQA